MASGAQLSVLVLTEGLLRENGPDSLSVHSHLLLSLCVKKYVSSIRNNRRALSRNYFSVLASNLVKSYLSEESRTYLGEWHSIAADPDASQDLVTMATDVPIGRTWPEILVRDFSTGVKVSEVEDKPSSLPADIHHLVASNTPVKDNGHCIVNVYYVMSSSSPVSPSCVGSLADSLLCLTQFHNANVELILPDNAPWDQTWAEPLVDWTSMIGVAGVSPASQWQPSWDVMWRGSVTLPPLQHDTSTGMQDEDSEGSCSIQPFFSGFSLSLLSSNVSDWEGTKLELLSTTRQEGACHFHYSPSHLELMMSLEGPEPVPPKFVSPIRGRLTLSNGSPQSSNAMFQHFLNSPDTDVAYLARLMLSPSSCTGTSGRCTRILPERDFLQRCAQENTTQPAMYEPESFVAGPVLLLRPNLPSSPSLQDHHENEGGVALSCDAQFLWKLDDICSSSRSEASSSVKQGKESPQDLETPLPQIGLDENSRFSHITWKSKPLSTSSETTTPPEVSLTDNSQLSPGKKKKKKKRRKDLLGQAVVVALKKNGLSRNMPLFKPCYVKLFNLTKLFMKGTNPSNLEAEIQHVVKLNAKNVITFHLEQSRTTSNNSKSKSR